MEEPGATTEAGPKLAVTPAGNPLEPKATVPLKPLIEETVTVLEPAVPAITLTGDGEAESEKSGPGFTISDTLAECERLPLVPVIVMV